ncbi:MAG: 4Fe-4S binding protein [Clostridia bacterium]|nr:4Fe-4S binding protein [Clostridia bacterium]
MVAVPVFGGRIPSLVNQKLAQLQGKGKKAVTAAVYGVRAFEDALLELNDVMQSAGFEVIASAALVAQHSIVPEVGAGRPDAADAAEIRQFARRVLTAMERGSSPDVIVPGNRPYKAAMKVPASPLSLPACVGCGRCASACPSGAVTLTGEGVVTDAGKCMMCMACTAACPVQARILPPPLQSGMTEKLGALRDVRRENQFFGLNQPE